MSDFFPSEQPSSENLREVSVSDLANSIKRTIESSFDRVRVRGELGRVTIAKSGHLYADLKDSKAVINTVMWKGSVSRLPFRPEEGLEVIAEGKLSTFPGRSNYQLIADTMQPAGAGALMALLEERKKKLAAEGLFAAERKKNLPFLPRTIGVVTSPTGAVIRDILHRLRDRFPVDVLLWPVLVQGEKAATQIADGINGFNAIQPGSSTPRPDLIIVARGGGSIEDLWPFNEEVVVRATAASDIPLISAVGHETDTTLIDYASDQRAPTPTGAAEMAVPVRTELLQRLTSLDQRMFSAITNRVKQIDQTLKSLSARLPRPDTLFETRQQRYDYAEGRLTSALQSMLIRKTSNYDQLAPRLRPQILQSRLQNLEQQVSNLSGNLGKALRRTTEKHLLGLQGLEGRLDKSFERLSDTTKQEADISNRSIRLENAYRQQLTKKQDRLKSATGLLEALSYQSTLKRGYTIIRDDAGELVRNADVAKGKERMVISFSDGDVNVVPNVKSTSMKKTPPKPAKKDGEQGSLF